MSLYPLPVWEPTWDSGRDEMALEILKQARCRLVRLQSIYICWAIEVVGGQCPLVTEMTKSIAMTLHPWSAYESWLASYVSIYDQSPIELRAARIAWMDIMIDKVTKRMEAGDETVVR